MRLLAGSLVALCLLAGCSLTPPKPPRCEGEFKPVNAPAYQQSSLSLNQAESLALCENGASHA